MSFEAIVLKGGARVTVDWSSRSRCKKCKAEIFWAVTTNIKNMPICRDADGQFISHFANCTAADEFRRRYSPGAGDLLDEVHKQNARERW